MCKCTPEIRTPFCGKLNCEWPKPEGTRTVTSPNLPEESAVADLSKSVDLPQWVTKEAEKYSGRHGRSKEDAPHWFRLAVMRDEQAFEHGAQAVLERVAPLLEVLEWIANPKPDCGIENAAYKAREALEKWNS